ncbi:GNAT family N-acetyltransferase [Streptomyces sp. NBC_00140]|uniref:GNAT family N-acetyltransferase n=1 Tax=Streptomyces sp. NBC_00140 TaxID=2975664 RepID=UPI0022585207|nr:GNAT family N-acetyltransferase [Streptomyces sp. NBC_00140]MCX5334282.1 ANTAR domain-containing protein [Streptomyces sp. NBC_00140]
MADLYAESCATAPGWEHRGRKDFLRRPTRDTWRPGFAMLAAEAPDLVGCAFGFPVPRDSSWWSGLRGTLPQDVEQLTTSGQVFAISGIVVRPSERYHGLADRLQERLLADHRALLGATLVDRTHRAACAGFRSGGWRDIGLVYRPPGPAVLRALVLIDMEQAFSALRAYARAHNRRLTDLARTFTDGTEPLNGLIV